MELEFSSLSLYPKETPIPTDQAWTDCGSGKTKGAAGENGFSERVGAGTSELVHLLPRLFRNPDLVLSEMPQ